MAPTHLTKKLGWRQQKTVKLGGTFSQKVKMGRGAPVCKSCGTISEYC